jgi:hypothetical protein
MLTWIRQWLTQALTWTEEATEVQDLRPTADLQAEYLARLPQYWYWW